METAAEMLEALRGISESIERNRARELEIRKMEHGIGHHEGWCRGWAYGNFQTALLALVMWLPVAVMTYSGELATGWVTFMPIPPLAIIGLTIWLKRDMKQWASPEPELPRNHTHESGS